MQSHPSSGVSLLSADAEFSGRPHEAGGGPLTFFELPLKLGDLRNVLHVVGELLEAGLRGQALSASPPRSVRLRKPQKHSTKGWMISALPSRCVRGDRQVALAPPIDGAAHSEDHLATTRGRPRHHRRHAAGQIVPRTHARPHVHGVAHGEDLGAWRKVLQVHAVHVVVQQFLKGREERLGPNGNAQLGKCQITGKRGVSDIECQELKCGGEGGGRD